MSSSPTWPDKTHDARGPLDGLGLLALRVWAAQEFMQAGWHKLSGGLSAPAWFAGLDFPFPLHMLPVNMNWLSAGLGEVVLGTALLLGLFSRLSALGLLFITWVAVYTVHFDLGWAGWNQIDTEDGQGFKVPLMLAIMLVAITTQGGGQWSLDAWRGRSRRHQPPESGS